MEFVSKDAINAAIKQLYGEYKEAEDSTIESPRFVNTNGDELSFKNLGLTPTSAITLFYIQAIRTNSIPFDLIAEKPNKTTTKAIKEAEEDIKKHSKSETYRNVKELKDDLLK